MEVRYTFDQLLAAIGRGAQAWLDGLCELLPEEALDGLAAALPDQDALLGGMRAVLAETLVPDPWCRAWDM